jgi:hypothetical protein
MYLDRGTRGCERRGWRRLSPAAYTATALFTLATLLFTGCGNPEKAARREAKWEQNIAQARLRVLDQLPDLDPASQEMIRTNRPFIAYSGVPFGGNYWFRWAISSNRVVELDALSSPNDVSKSRVKIRRGDSASKYGTLKTEK